MIDRKWKSAPKPTIIQTLLLPSTFAMTGSPLQTQDNVLVKASDQTPTFSNMKCERDYKYHVQGVCTNERYTVCWSVTTDLVETDRLGLVQRKVAIANRHGDLCFSDEKLSVAVKLANSTIQMATPIPGSKFTITWHCSNYSSAAASCSHNQKLRG